MERMIRGGVARLSQRIERDLRIGDTGLQVPHIKRLLDFTASVLHCRSVNTSEIAAVVPRAVSQDDSRYRMLNRWLKNPLIDPLRTMCGFIPELIEQACRDGKTAVLMLDQSEARLSGSSCVTSIGVLHEKGHKEPWIIAMDGVPTVARVRDYGMRWGIEALFSDFKSRGFGITQTKLRHAERIARLILVLTMATYFAVSTAMKPDPETPKYALKKPIAA